MPTPSIQTLTTDAQQVLNLDSISAVRSVVAVALANANTGTPLNPNLTTQQLWDQFYQVVTKPKSDIESIIANQLMKFLYSPPAPGGVGADKQVIFNDGGVLAGDSDFIWNKTLNLLTVTGSANITADLTVDGGTLKVDSSNNWVGINKTPTVALDVSGAATITGALTVDTSTLKVDATNHRVIVGHTTGSAPFQVTNAGGAGLEIQPTGVNSNPVLLSYNRGASSYGQLTLDGSSIVCNLSGSTAMTLNSTGLGIGAASPDFKFAVNGTQAVPDTTGSSTTNGSLRIGAPGTNLVIDTGVTAAASVYGWIQSRSRTNYANNYDLVLQPNGGNLGIGVTPSAGKGCLQLSSGINFPATQVASTDPNTLDDYEEGTWTGTLKGATTDPTTPVTATGRYTKIGRQVSIQIQFNNADTTGASGQIKVAGSPFTSNSSVSSIGPVMMSSIGTFTGVPAAFIGTGTTEIELYAFSSAGAQTFVTHNAGTTRSLWVSLTYTV